MRAALSSLRTWPPRSLICVPAILKCSLSLRVIFRSMLPCAQSYSTVAPFAVISKLMCSPPPQTGFYAIHIFIRLAVGLIASVSLLMRAFFGQKRRWQRNDCQSNHQKFWKLVKHILCFNLLRARLAMPENPRRRKIQIIKIFVLITDATRFWFFFTTETQRTQRFIKYFKENSVFSVSLWWIFS